MTRTEELLQRAKDGFHLRDRSDIPEFVQLIELVRLQNEALVTMRDELRCGDSWTWEHATEPIAAFNKFEQGGE